MTVLALLPSHLCYLPRHAATHGVQRFSLMALEQSGANGAVSGRVVAVHGSVIDVKFETGVLPAINEALLIDWDLGAPLVTEVQQHLNPSLIRAVALQNPSGLKRAV